MFIGEAERSIVGSAAIYAAVTNTLLCLTKGIRLAVCEVMLVERERDRAVGYAVQTCY
jgi:hypothetical protein